MSVDRRDESYPYPSEDNTLNSGSGRGGAKGLEEKEEEEEA